MNGHKCLVLAFGLLTAAGGCAGLDKSQADKQPAMTQMTDQDSSKKGPDGPRKAPTATMCVAAGDYFMNNARNLASAPALQEKEYDKARKEYQQAIHLDPKLMPAYEGLANLYLTLDDFDHALATYKKALQITPTNHAFWNEMGMCYCRKKDWNKGVECLSKAVELDPENRKYVKDLGYTLAHMGRYDASLKVFATVQPVALAHYELARMLMQTQQVDLCRQHLQLALQENPKLEEARTMLVSINAGLAQASAEADIQQASYQEPINPSRSPYLSGRQGQQPSTTGFAEAPPAPEPAEPALLPPPPQLQIDPGAR
jgi:tetratricopeptide (TPR) repeat protein